MSYTRLNPNPTTRTVSASGTITANGNTDFTMTPPTVNGYTPVGVIGVTSSAYNVCIPGRFIFDNGDVIVTMRNVYTSALTPTVYATVLYLPS